MMRRLDVAVILTGASYSWLVITVIWGGLYYPGYTHGTQFMSELGATGAPHGNWVNYFGFIGTELLLFGALGIAFTRLSKTSVNLIGFAFLVAYPLLLSVAAFSPCDFECRPTDPTFTHLIHITTGLGAYMCAIIGLAILSRQSGNKAPSKGIKTAGLFLVPILLFLLFNLTPDNSLAGAFQRIAETLIYIWMIFWLTTLSNNFMNETMAAPARMDD